MAVDAERLDHEAVEMPQQEIGQVEGPGLRFRELGECGGRREELVAVRARDALDAFLGEHGIELAARSAVAVGDEDAVVVLAQLPDLLADRARDLLGPVVQLGRQADDVEAGPAVGLAQGGDLVGERAAGDDELAGLVVHRTPQWAWAARRSASRRFAVSTAMAASRQ